MAIYKCWIPEYGHEPDDGLNADALDHSQAAWLFIADYERRSAEFPVGSGEGTVTVVVEGEGERKRFYVSGNPEPAYYVRERRDD